MDYTERLRRLAWNQPLAVAGSPARVLDVKTLALVRIAAAAAMGATAATFGTEADAALAAGATVDEIVDVLFAVGSVVGQARIVLAAPQLALALGYDTESEL